MVQDYWVDKAAVVTGGARGQGAAEVIRLLSAGAIVYAVDVLPDNGENWGELRSASDAWKDRLHIVHTDVSSAKSGDDLAARLKNDDVKLYALVNNAGITLRKTVTQTSPEEWERLIGINLNGAFLGIRALAPLMKRGGAIVNISSTAGLTGYFSAAYCASKWGLLGLSRAAALELADKGIRVNSICPGLVETPMALLPNAEHDAEKTKAFFDGNRDATLLSRGADPDEIAAAVMFLLGPDASFITGADLPVDGGMTGGGIYWRIGKATGNL
ncbi:SDR family oxidoreductase [Brucella oryzae]|uniref:SDR family NAD(P)-dependent oxidoreductase n=1 Tax=Brucella oryzae TaxID=335286 RepID=UPI001B8128E0|nr:SDR family NAD(P)-dependent oxidoreductase [Brucella oryzae]MBR7652224.1 SDR family oxidoreductase [Brucella oryzae]